MRSVNLQLKPLRLPGIYFAKITMAWSSVCIYSEVDLTAFVVSLFTYTLTLSLEKNFIKK